MRKKRPKMDAPQPIEAFLERLLAKMGGRPGKERLAELWQNWVQAIGPELGSLAIPLGSKKSILLLGAASAVQMQELHFMSGAILAAANAYLQRDYFTDIRISVLGERKTRARQPQKYGNNCSQANSAARLTGKYLAAMNPSSPVARCYALFAGKKTLA